MQKKNGVRVRYFAYHTPGTVPNMAKITKTKKNAPEQEFKWVPMCDKY